MKPAVVEQPVVQLADVTKVFGASGGGTVAVQNVSMEARPGELLMLLGPSGSGKTTLLTLIAGLIRPSSGSVSLFGSDIEEIGTQQLQQLRSEKVGFIFQTFRLIDSLTAEENVALVMRFARRSRAFRKRRVDELFVLLQIEHLRGKFPPSMSQGEKQRVAVARALANDGRLIIADEPTANLEAKQGSEIIQLLHRLAIEENRCVIVASHDLRLVELADRILHLEDGLIQRVETAA